MKILIQNYDLPESWTEEFSKNLGDSGIETSTVKEPGTTWGAAEWVIPGLFSVVLLKSFFDGFLEEAGKDSYASLMKGILLLVKKAKREQPIHHITQIEDGYLLKEIYSPTSKRGKKKVEKIFDKLIKKGWSIDSDNSSKKYNFFTVVVKDERITFRFLFFKEQPVEEYKIMLGKLPSFFSQFPPGYDVLEKMPRVFQHVGQKERKQIIKDSSYSIGLFVFFNWEKYCWEISEG